MGPLYSQPNLSRNKFRWLIFVCLLTCKLAALTTVGKLSLGSDVVTSSIFKSHQSCLWVNTVRWKWIELLFKSNYPGEWYTAVRRWCACMQTVCKYFSFWENSNRKVHCTYIMVNWSIYCRYDVLSRASYVRLVSTQILFECIDRSLQTHCTNSCG